MTGDHLGRSVAGMGDVDGDGIPDFAVGLPAEVDRNFSASRPGKVRVYSGADGALIYELDGARWLHLPWQFGHKVGSGRDVNGDGIQDLIVSVPYFPSFTPGSVWVFSGADGTLLWIVPLYSPFENDSGFIGDLNGDGLAEFATSMQNFNNYKGRIWIWAGASGSVERHCPGAANSTGQGARLEQVGPISVGYAALSLELRSAPPGQPALVFYGSAQAPLPLANGELCVALGPGPFRLTPANTTGPMGEALFPIDWTAPPATSSPSALAPGSTWTFQAWYRDPPAPPAASNLSDALTLTFVP